MAQVFDVFLGAGRALLDPRPSVVFCNLDVAAAYGALAVHATQLVWFRRLFILFSAYTFCNRLTDLPYYVYEPDPVIGLGASERR